MWTRGRKLFAIIILHCVAILSYQSHASCMRRRRGGWKRKPSTPTVIVQKNSPLQTTIHVFVERLKGECLTIESCKKISLNENALERLDRSEKRLQHRIDFAQGCLKAPTFLSLTSPCVPLTNLEKFLIDYDLIDLQDSFKGNFLQNGLHNSIVGFVVQNFKPFAKKVTDHISNDGANAFLSMVSQLLKASHLCTQKTRNDLDRGQNLKEIVPFCEFAYNLLDLAGYLIEFGKTMPKLRTCNFNVGRDVETEMLYSREECIWKATECRLLVHEIRGTKNMSKTMQENGQSFCIVGPLMDLSARCDRKIGKLLVTCATTIDENFTILQEEEHLVIGRPLSEVNKHVVSTAMKHYDYKEVALRNRIEAVRDARYLSSSCSMHPKFSVLTARPRPYCVSLICEIPPRRRALDIAKINHICLGEGKKTHDGRLMLTKGLHTHFGIAHLLRINGIPMEDLKDYFDKEPLEINPKCTVAKIDQNNKTRIMNSRCYQSANGKKTLFPEGFCERDALEVCRLCETAMRRGKAEKVPQFEHVYRTRICLRKVYLVVEFCFHGGEITSAYPFDPDHNKKNN